MVWVLHFGFLVHSGRRYSKLLYSDWLIIRGQDSWFWLISDDPFLCYCWLWWSCSAFCDWSLWHSRKQIPSSNTIEKDSSGFCIWTIVFSCTIYLPVIVTVLLILHVYIFKTSSRICNMLRFVCHKCVQQNKQGKAEYCCLVCHKALCRRHTQVWS